MPQKKKKPSAAPLTVATKASFFDTKREYSEVTKTALPVAPPLLRQRLLYDKETGMPYAEIINNAAMCLNTGEELFRFKDRIADAQPAAFESRFDFTPPGGKKHPFERTVDVSALVEAGILSNADVASHRAFSDEELEEMTQKLSEYQTERETLSSFRME